MRQLKIKKVTPKKGKVTATKKKKPSGAKTYTFKKKSGPGKIGIKKKK